MWWHVCTALTGRICCVCVWISGCKAGGWLLGYAWKTSGMCWCLHFSPLTGSICCCTIETVLDGLGVRDPGGFLHIWQRLALLPGESRPTGGWLRCGPRPLDAQASGGVWICPTVTAISTCFSNFITPTSPFSSSSPTKAPSHSLTPTVPRLAPPPNFRWHGFPIEDLKGQHIREVCRQVGKEHSSALLELQSFLKVQ